MNLLLRNDRLVRWLHPAAWWAWSLCAAAAASLTSNPLALFIISLAAASVIVQRRSHAPWAAGLRTILQLATLVIALRLLLQIALGASTGTHVLLRLPEVPLPAFLSGIRLGGPLTAESLVVGAVEGLRFASILLSIAAATTVASPSRLFRAFPDVLSEVASVGIITMTFAPHLVDDFARIRAARRWRGRATRGLRSVIDSLLPVLEGALERSLDLAAAMTSRGYGRARAQGSGRLLLAVTAITAALAIGSSLSPALPPWIVVACVGISGGTLLAAAYSLGRQAARTRHRADPWRPVEWFTLACGVVAVIGTLLAGAALETGVPIAPLRWPDISPLYATTLAALALPAFLSPLTPRVDGN